MALITCWECKAEISNTASSCPHCGATHKAAPVLIVRDPEKKSVWPWILGVPLALFGLFILFGLSIPQYKSDALARRNICEKLVIPAQLSECDRIYDAEMAKGRALEEERRKAR